MKRKVMDGKALDRTLKRMAHEILERNKTTDDLVLIGIKRRGVNLSQRLVEKIEVIEGVRLPMEVLDITFYRDDLSRKDDSPHLETPVFNQSLTDKRCIIVDDVIFTGRTVRAAMDAILEASRPSNIQLAVLVDRGHRDLPIRPDYVGKNLPTSKQERIEVLLEEVDGSEEVLIIS